jgi:hypothetical protein
LFLSIPQLSGNRKQSNAPLTKHTLSMVDSGSNSHLKPTPPDIVHDLFHIDLSEYGITLPAKKILRNPPVPILYENALRYEPEATELTVNGALVAWSGAKTGRSPKDKRIVEDELTK